jgi:hypothetical protein
MENPNQSYEKLSEHLITTLRRVNNKIKAKLNLEKDVDLANLSLSSLIFTL